MNSVVKTMNKQTITAKHAKEMTAGFGAFGSLTWENQFIVISVTTGVKNMTSSVFNWALTLHQRCARTYSPTQTYFRTSPVFFLLAPRQGDLPAACSVRTTFRRFPVPYDNQFGLDLCHDQVEQVKEKFLTSETHRY